MKRILHLTVAVAVGLVSLATLADRRPVEGRWVVEGARGQQVPAYPQTYHLLAGDSATLRFRVEPQDLTRYFATTARATLAPELHARSLAPLTAEETLAYAVQPQKPGQYDLELRLDSAERGFTLTFPVRLVVHPDLAAVEAALCPPPPPGPLRAEPAGTDANPENSRAPSARAPENYAHIHGLALSYAYPNNRRYTLRGLTLELYDNMTEEYLGTVRTADPLGEGMCETEFNDYVNISDGSYHHVTNSGSFDFGNVYVGPAGRDLMIREVFQFHAGASGAAADGAHRFTTEEYGTVLNTQITLDWVIGNFQSGHENAVWLQNSTFTLSASNGQLGDEAQHVQVDASRYYHFFAECVGWSSADPVRFIIDMADTDSAYCDGDDVYLNAETTGYLDYGYADTIRHEYTHAFQWRIRGGSRPPRGGENHGGCANSLSGDALTEGYAEYAPVLAFRDAQYNWGDAYGMTLDACEDYCTSVPDDRSEWAVARALWKSGALTGTPESFFMCSGSALVSGTPDTVEAFFAGILAACPLDRDIWAGFNCSHINYDTTPPANPSPIECTTDFSGWTHDPTWSWSEPDDDLSGVGGYSVQVVAGPDPVPPDTVEDIAADLSYHTDTLPPDGLLSFSIRARDRAGNWSPGFTSHLSVLDRVPPGLATGLAGGNPPYLGAWSNTGAVTFSWSPATDDRSGLDGYAWEVVVGATGLPGASKNLEEDATSLFVTLPSSTDAQYFALRSRDNAGNWSPDAVRRGPFWIDAVPPDAATGFGSTSHEPGVWSNDTTVDFAWGQAPDAHSGIQGYSTCSDVLACTPVEAATLGDVTTMTVTLAHGDVGYYTSLRAVDNAGNWADSWPTWGPVLIDTVAPTAPGGLSSGTHPLGIENCVTGDGSFSISWTGAYDGNSGVAAYAYSFSTGDWARPPEADHLPAGATTATLTAPRSTQPQFFNLMARDAAGNWSDFVSYGPFFGDRTPLPVGNILLSKPTGNPEGVVLDWNGTGETGYLVEWATALGEYPDAEWSDNAGYDAALAPWQTYTHEAPPEAPVVYYRVKGRNACGVTGE